MKSKLILLTLLFSSLMNMNPSKIKRIKEGTLEIVPVKNLKTEDENALVFNNRHLLPLTKKPILRVENFSYEKLLSKKTDLIKLDEKTQRDFERGIKQYKGNNFAVIINGEIVSTPRIKEPKKDSALI
ncbi:MAG: hypothetical protein A2381_01645 [Bdellovibrionales bacterium RIFOXYB1_FULL_37_110]|nr:MAG: hypothetical protein A2417_15870 [Bdellovibrionales bacterium RIFOXYC1_FULL_37_79]OFZ58919.1 MAG: hypothetical protein A2381_01645 [Bdellovibrionales bacterium RIFOXYB1_FULL_37_110]OFZ64635.1 MAG: hypothetical protein A2577_13290 [Bdellovibrionales bacterium RIFOXYD1_FULL_36_51]